MIDIAEFRTAVCMRRGLNTDESLMLLEAIENARAQLKKSTDTLGEMIHVQHIIERENASLLAMNQRLVALCELRGEALRPFATAADDDDQHDGGALIGNDQHVKVKIGDCRRAREAREATP